MCPSYLDGEPTNALHKNDRGVITHHAAGAGVRRQLAEQRGYAARLLAIVQFSSISEDGRRVIPAPRSLRTEQRSGQEHPYRVAWRSRSLVDVSGTPSFTRNVLDGGL